MSQKESKLKSSIREAGKILKERFIYKSDICLSILKQQIHERSPLFVLTGDVFYVLQVLTFYIFKKIDAN